MKKWIIVLLSLLLLTGCTDLKRLKKNRQKRKLEKLVNVLGVDSSFIQMDTLVIEKKDTLTFPAITIDTILEYKIDSIYVATQDGVKTEIKIMTDSVWFETYVFERDTVIVTKDTTIIKEIIKTVNTTPEAPKDGKWRWWHYLLAGTVLSLIGTSAILRLKQ